MLNIFYKSDNRVVKEEYKYNYSLSDSSILWIDLINPSSKEVNEIAKDHGVDIPTKEEREEIESSARYWEDTTSITINTRFLIKPDDEFQKDETVTFLLHKNILFTIRYSEFRVFDDIEQRVLASPRNFSDGFDLISKIFEVRVEKDADIIEDFAIDIRSLRKCVFESVYDYREVLSKLSNLQDINTRLRDSLFDKRRALTSLLSTDKMSFETKKNVTVVVKDLNSLIDFCVANASALDNIYSLFASQINIEQNKTIKIFTVVTVVMMPPSLIGTIYGMNFHFMPELAWKYAYPIVLLVMLISMVIPVIYFKKKEWI